jgi:hypothetical protein
MTIVVDVDSKLCVQVIKQMNKLVNVLQATDVSQSAAVSRDRAAAGRKPIPTAVLKEAEIFGARGRFLAGRIGSKPPATQKVRVLEVMRSYGEIEISRPRGSDVARRKNYASSPSPHAGRHGNEFKNRLAVANRQQLTVNKWLNGFLRKRRAT